MADKDIAHLIDQVVAGLESREAATRNAFQKIDEITKIIGMRYRPDWAQPIHDDWQQTVRDLRELRAAFNGR